MSEDPYRHARAAQEQRLDVIDNSLFDVAIVGGGINGACLYHHLCHRGFRVLLVECGDFYCGTSQASAMMIWGGLVYLKDLELATVWRLCAARDRMVAELGDWVRPRMLIGHSIVDPVIPFTESMSLARCLAPETRPCVAIIGLFAHVDLNLNWRSLKSLVCDVMPDLQRLWGLIYRVIRA